MFNQFTKCYMSASCEHHCRAGNKDEWESPPAPKNIAVELEG